jgi:cytochrome b561
VKRRAHGLGGFAVLHRAGNQTVIQPRVEAYIVLELGKGQARAARRSLLLILARLIYRLSHGAPPDEPTLEWWQKGAAHLNHWGLYLMLLVVPILGYVGISLYPALDIFGLFSLPGVVAPNQDAAARVLYWHWLGALAIVLLVGVHVAAALFHYFIRKDGVLRRMWVRAGRLS